MPPRGSPERAALEQSTVRTGRRVCCFVCVSPAVAQASPAALQEIANDTLRGKLLPAKAIVGSVKAKESESADFRVPPDLAKGFLFQNTARNYCRLNRVNVTLNVGGHARRFTASPPHGRETWLDRRAPGQSAAAVVARAAFFEWPLVSTDSALRAPLWLRITSMHPLHGPNLALKAKQEWRTPPRTCNGSALMLFATNSTPESIASAHFEVGACAWAAYAVPDPCAS
jgi:hypothetical protein